MSSSCSSFSTMTVLVGMGDVPAQALDDAQRFAECHLEHEWVDRHGSFTVSGPPAGTPRGYPDFLVFRCRS
jgi:hypothetical protein